MFTERLPRALENSARQALGAQGQTKHSVWPPGLERSAKKQRENSRVSSIGGTKEDVGM